MKKARILICILLVLTLLIFSFSACNKEETITKVKLNEVTHSIFYAPQYVAMNEGLFEEEGLEIELTNGAGADKVLTAVISGDADIGFCGPEATLYVYNGNKDDYVVTFAQLTKRDGSFLLAREPDENFTFEKVIGKDIIGGRKGGMPEMSLEWVLKQHDIIPGEDVNVDTSIQFAAMAGAFKGGTGDYVALFEPTALAMEKEGAGYVVASIGVESGEVPYTCYNAKKSFIDANPDLIQKFTNAVYKGLMWVQNHTPEEIAAVIQDQFPDTDLDDLTAVVKRYKDQDTWSLNPVLTEESFEHMQDIVEEAGELDVRTPYDALVDSSFANEAVDTIK
ncbi:MAG: ABC transporter substrate-binding protein [Eubacteriales bacterium]